MPLKSYASLGCKQLAAQIHNYNFITSLSYDLYFLQDVPCFKILDNFLKYSAYTKYEKLCISIS